ncbi:MAG: hypothetical protein IJP43_05910 [Oscillospiraceae bacterium]|nr:hypothetical protein [Oscillospiraceae bacterium]
MITAGEIFECAMALIDELDEEGSAYSADTEIYARRAPSMISSLAEEARRIAGKRGEYGILDDLEDIVEDVDDSYAAGILPYGLAAALLHDENPASAGFLQTRYEEMRDWYADHAPAAEEQIEDIYGVYDW